MEEGPPSRRGNSEGCRYYQTQECQSRERAQKEQGRNSLASLSHHSDLLLVSPTGQPQLRARWQRRLGDAVHKFLRHRTGQRGAENGSSSWEGQKRNQHISILQQNS